MKAKDLLTIGTAALGTAALTVAAFWARPIDAGSEAEASLAKVAPARLFSHGVELELVTAGGRTFKSGEQAEFELSALNTTDQPTSASVCVRMAASSLADAFARTVRMPRVIWQRDEFVTLGPKETKTLALSTSTNLPPKSMISVSLREAGQQAGTVVAGITALTFSTTERGDRPVIALVQ